MSKEFTKLNINFCVHQLDVAILKRIDSKSLSVVDEYEQKHEYLPSLFNSRK